MRLPFLQVSQEEIARARTMSGYLGVSFAHALGMTVALKAAALEAAPEGDVSGAITDSNPAEWIAVQCGWPLERADALASAMARCGFVMAGPCGGHAVAGMEPYARALDTSGKRSEAGKKGAEARKSMGGYGKSMARPSQTHGHGVAPDAKTQTQTQTQKEETTLSAGADGEPESLPDATDDAEPVAEAPAPFRLLPAEPGRPPEKPKKKPAPNPEMLREVWNRVAPPLGFQVWEAMGDDRKRDARLALEACSDIAKWEAWLRCELDRPWNRGENPDGWKANVEWFLRKKNRNLVIDFNPAVAAVAAPRGDVPRLGPRPVVVAAPPVNPDKPRL